jgi:hypothetical protein
MSHQQKEAGMAYRKMTVLLAGAVGASLAAYADPLKSRSGHDLPPGLAKQGKIPPGHAKKIWGKGQYLPIEYHDAYIEEWRRYELREAPRGYRWVHVDEDVYLVDLATGLVAEAIVGLLN